MSQPVALATTMLLAPALTAWASVVLHVATADTPPPGEATAKARMSATPVTPTKARAR